MDLNALVDVTTGLALLYLLLALFVTIVNEWISSLFKLRARNLERALKQLLEGKGDEIWEAFRQSPTFRNLCKASVEQRWFGLPAVGPSYIGGERFADALVETAAQYRGLDITQVVPDLDEVIAGLPDSDIKRQLASLAAGGDRSLGEAKQRVGRWFDEVMERAGGVFVRRMQAISFAVAAVLAVGLNVDSIHIAKKLWQDEALRAVLASEGRQLAGAGQQPAGLSEKEWQALGLFPIGWHERLDARGAPAGYGLSGWQLVSTVFGWLLSAAAISLGAPFWFGLLSRVARIRGTGAAPPKEPATPAAGG